MLVKSVILLTSVIDGPTTLSVSAKKPTRWFAENSSVGPVEDVSASEDFSQMNRGTDVITEKERARQNRIG